MDFLDTGEQPPEQQYPLLKFIAENQPEMMSMFLDGNEVYRAKFTDEGLKTIFNLPVDLSKPRRLITLCFDGSSTPIYSLNLNGETG